MKNSNTKAHYLTDGKWHQLERHCWFFRTIAVLNTAPGSNINIKEIIGNYECSSLARRLFDASSLPNHGKLLKKKTENQIWYMQFAIP